MKRGVGKRGLTLSEELLWKGVEVIAALFLVLLLWGYIDSSVQGGMLAKQFYPGEIGLVSSVVAASPDTMSVGTFIGKFDKTEFTVEAGRNIVGVYADTLKGPSRFWVFTPAGTVFKDAKIVPATGIVHVVKEGNSFTLRKDAAFNGEQRVCPYVVTKAENALALRHHVGIVGNATETARLESVAALVRARMPNARQAVQGLTGVAVILRFDPAAEDKDRVLAYYNAEASDDVKARSRKLGCLVENAVQRAFPNDGMAVVPSLKTGLPADVPGIELVLGHASAAWWSEPVDLQKALVEGLEAYYG